MPASPTGGEGQRQRAVLHGDAAARVDLRHVDQHALAQRKRGEGGLVGGRRALVAGAAVHIVEQEARQAALGERAPVGGGGGVGHGSGGVGGRGGIEGVVARAAAHRQREQQPAAVHQHAVDGAGDGHRVIAEHGAGDHQRQRRVCTAVSMPNVTDWR